MSNYPAFKYNRMKEKYEKLLDVGFTPEQAGTLIDIFLDLQEKISRI